MYYLLCAALLGAAAAVPLTEVEPRNEVDYAALYSLPRECTPVFYDVRLFLDPRNETYFNGKVSIRIIPNIETDEIVMHAQEMIIDDIKFFTDRDSDTDLFLSYTLATDDTHFLRIKVNTTLTPLVSYVIHIDYTSRFAVDMFGVYRSTYDAVGGRKSLITSQLQPTFARRAFPCFDEPAMKAIFRTTIYAPPQFPTVRSNMPRKSLNESIQAEVEGLEKFEFEDTLIMSTYLLAYLVSEFQYIDNAEEPIYRVPFKVYSRDGTQENARFALDFGQRNMIALENYTEFDYAFPKLDKAAVPDFAAGAMENWGLVIYREVALLYSEGVTTTSTKQNIGRIICHENMHQWFGNEVGPYSWTYTWLNEGFANFFENYATDLTIPDWRMMDQYVISLQNVFQSDAVLTVNPMTHPVYTPAQIISTFNSVAYQKSGSVIRMAQHFLTPEVFRQGLIRYIKDMSRKAAQPSNLFNSWQQALDASNHNITYRVAAILNRWTSQGGFPVVTVRRSAPTAESLTFEQERYLTDRSLTGTERWHIPINWVLSTNVDFSDTSPQSWVRPSLPATAVDIPGLSQANWFIINKQQTGYYRVNYERENWRALVTVLNTSHTSIHLLNRAQLIDDSFNLARNGRIEYDIPLEIATYLLKESDYIPWAAANAAFNYLDIALSSSNVYDLFQKFLLELSAPLYERLGFNAVSSEEHVTAYHRTIILNFNCQHGNQDCINTAQQLLEGFKNGQTINPDIQTTVLCSGLRGGDAANFDFLWNRFSQTTDSSEQSILLNAMGCTSNQEKRTFYLNQVIDDASIVREQDRHTIIVAVINSSPENMEAALDFVVENFNLIKPRVQGLSGTTNILNAFARRLTSPQHAVKIDEFMKRHDDGTLTSGEVAGINAIRENIAASITWSNENAGVIEAWLRDYYTDGASIVSAGFLVFVSVIIAVFNH